MACNPGLSSKQLGYNLHRKMRLAGTVIPRVPGMKMALILHPQQNGLEMCL